MKIAVLGATGRAGTRIIQEALQRGHSVTAISRSSNDTNTVAGLPIVIADGLSPNLPELLRHHDLVVSAMRFVTVPAHAVVSAVKLAGVKRLVVVGGSGSLEVAPGVQLVDTPALPEIYRAEASAGRVFLNDLKLVDDLDWTFIRQVRH